MRGAFIKMSAASEIKHMSCQNNLFLKYNNLPELIKKQPKMGVAASYKNLQMSAKPLKR